MTHRSDRTEIYSRVTPDALTRTTLSLIELDNALEYLKERMMFYEDMGVTARRPITGHSALSTLLPTILQEEKVQYPIKAIYTFSQNRFFKVARAIDLAYFIKV